MSTEKEKSEKPKKGNFFTSLFVEEVEVPDTNDEVSKEVVSSTPQVTPIIIPTVTPTSFSPTNIPVPSAGSFDEKVYNGLHQTIEANDTKDISYIKYIKSKKALDAIPGMTDALKYTSAFATIQANNPNLTKDILLKTADISIQILENELKDFSAAVAAEKDKKVNSKLQQIVAKNELINQKTIEIQKLQEEVAGLQNEANQSSIKIENSEKNFNCTLEIVKNEINTDKNNINTFLK